MKSEFVVSSSGRDSWPEAELPEVVVVGRSNVGKSSFINAFTGKSVWLTSATPLAKPGC